MNIDSFMLSMIIILFPLLVNILHDLYLKNSEKDKNDLFLDISLISSLYLFNIINESSICFLVTANIVFLVSLMKKRIFTSLIIFAFIVSTHYGDGMCNIYLLILQYILYFILYIIFYKKYEKLYITLFLFIKVIFIIIFYIHIESDNVFANSFFVSILFLTTTYLVVYVVKISEDIVALHISLKELEKEKRIKESLFKITHEIKNPIAVCKSYLDMFNFNNPDHERYIRILKEEMNNILILLKDFKNMTNIKIENEILDINMLLEEIARQLSPILKDDNIEFITDISDEELYIEGDYNRLRQVLTNFIKNAREAKDKNKESFISLKTKIENNKFIIKIEDNGIGMDEESLKKIEEPFYTTKKDGTGLGVPLSTEIIKSHNGDIHFTSKEGIGTKIIIELPFNGVEF